MRICGITIIADYCLRGITINWLISCIQSESNVTCTIWEYDMYKNESFQPKKHSIQTFSGSNAACLELMMHPTFENNHSDGVLVAGTQTGFHVISAIAGKWLQFCFHHCSTLTSTDGDASCMYCISCSAIFLLTHFFSANLLNMSARSIPSPVFASFEGGSWSVFVRVWLFILFLCFWTNMHHYFSNKGFMRCLSFVSIQKSIHLNLGSTTQANFNISVAPGFWYINWIFLAISCFILLLADEYVTLRAFRVRWWRSG